MKLSEVKTRQGKTVSVFRARFGMTCYYCGSEIPSGALAIAWDDSVPRHYRCGCSELGVTERADGTPI